MNIIKMLLVALSVVGSLACVAQEKKRFQPKEVYKTETLIITQVSENAFEHTSFLQTQDFGNVPCNGMVVRNSKEALVFDTPTNDTVSEELIGVDKEFAELQNKRDRSDTLPP